jgi:hypothetical protein
MFPMIQGIFHHIPLSLPADFPVSSATLDILFISEYGECSVSPLVLKIHEDGLSELTSDELTQLGEILYTVNKKKWEDLISLYMLDYDPIHNFSDTVHEVVHEDATSNDTLTHNTTLALDETKNIDRDVTRTDNLEEAITSENKEGYAGFNSSQSSDVSDGQSSTTRSNTGTQQNVTSDESKTNGTRKTTGTDTTGRVSDHDRTKDTTHIGNIGNITTQQLIKEEIDVKQWNPVSAILNDVKECLTIPLYL